MTSKGFFILMSATFDWLKSMLMRNLVLGDETQFERIDIQRAKKRTHWESLRGMLRI